MRHLVRGALAGTLASLLLGAPATAQTPRYLDPSYLRATDDAQLNGTVTPPGTDTRHATREVAAYDDLVQGYPKLTDNELRTRYFKQRLFGPTPDAQRTYSPRAGVTVIRDAKWGEPRIFGKTDVDMAFGAGFVAAEDRLPIMELLRALGRGEALQVAGTAPAWIADAQLARLYGYTEEEFQAQIDRLPSVYGQPGRDIVRMIDGYVAGINEYIAGAGRGELPLPPGLSALGLSAPGPWKPTDVVAVVSTIRSLFGAGGGSELNNAAVLAGLQQDLGSRLGRSVYDDFRNRQNADGPVHTARRFPYMQRDAERLDPNATPTEPIAGGSEGSAAELRSLARQVRANTGPLKLKTPIGTLKLFGNGGMSNFLAVGASRTAGGNPILIGGPQAAYFSPEILMDYELHSPTIHARGAGFPGLSTLVVLGRTRNYAWTPTAGGSDMIDSYVEKLCDPNGPATKESRFYEFRGKCLPMDRRTLREAPPGAPFPDVIVERTVHGPVVARGTLGGRPVAVTQKRSTYMKELDSAVSILKMNRGEASTGKKFVRIFRESHNLSTNWGYINDREIAYVHGGLYPVRPASVDPDLPVWGTGQWEWKQDAAGNDVYLGLNEVPNEVAPKRDYFVSWNNRPAPGWGGSDAQWGWSSVYRAKLLEDAILNEKPGTITPVRLVQMMEKAGLTDLRGRYVAPLALDVLAGRSTQLVRRCLPRRSPVGGGGIGPVRLGYTRDRLLQRSTARPVLRTPYSFRYCVTGASGGVSAVFSGRGRRGKAQLVATTARTHRLRRVGRGVRAHTMLRRFPRARRIGRGLYRASARSRRLFAVRGGRVRYVAVAAARLLRNRAALRRYLRRAGLGGKARKSEALGLRALARASAVDPRERKMIELLSDWIDGGALRRDGDGNGSYDQSAAVAIMDAWWEPLIRAVFDPVLGDAGRIPIGFDNAPGPTGSAYQDGFYGYLWTDLSMVLDRTVKSPTSRIYCGGSRAASGRLGPCAERVLASLEAAGDALASSQGPDPAGWRSNADVERIRFLPGAALSMHWVNRPTSQQITMFGRLARPRPRSCLARRSPIGPRNIGRIRLAYTRRRLARLPVKPARRTRRSYRYCVKGSTGRVTAVFSPRGRVRLITTTARNHRLRRVAPGGRLRALLRRFPRARAIGPGLYRAGPRSGRLFGLRRGRVRFVAVADRRLIANRRALRGYLRRAAPARRG